jgi:hypothetical protein
MVVGQTHLPLVPLVHIINDDGQHSRGALAEGIQGVIVGVFSRSYTDWT